MASARQAPAVGGGRLRFGRGRGPTPQADSGSTGAAGGASMRPGSSLPARRSRSSATGCWPKGSRGNASRWPLRPWPRSVAPALIRRPTPTPARSSGSTPGFDGRALDDAALAAYLAEFPRRGARSGECRACHRRAGHRRRRPPTEQVSEPQTAAGAGPLMANSAGCRAPALPCWVCRVPCRGRRRRSRPSGLESRT